MNLTPVAADHASALAWTTPGVRNETGRPFTEHLRLARTAGDAETAREAAEQFVSTAFIKPVLAMLRENNNADGPFAPGDAERRFGPLLDEQIADRIVKAAGFSLVDVVEDRLMAGAAASRGGTRPAVPLQETNHAAHSATRRTGI